MGIRDRFCERIFGPVKDWECHCGRYKKVKVKGIVCDRCGVEVTRSKVRRERMGHIELAAPVCHIWCLKGVPSPLSLILDIPPRPLEKVLYFASYIVTKVDRQRINDAMDEIRRVVAAEIEDIRAQRDANISESRKTAAKDIREQSAETPLSEDDIEDRQRELEQRVKEEENEASEREVDLETALKLLEGVQKFELITDDQYRQLERLLDVMTTRLEQDYTTVVEASMGGAAIKKLLQEVDVESLQRQLRADIAQTQGPKRARSIKRLEIVDAFIASKSRPEWMILDSVPVISPELRPMVQLLSLIHI